jgi:hypothetical protein
VTALLLLPPALSLLVLGAHFLRADAPLLMLVALVALAVLFLRRRWAARTVQVVLMLGTLEWVRATIVLTGERMSEGLAYGRMIAILGVVALVTVSSALVFRSRALRRWYRMDEAAGSRGAP